MSENVNNNTTSGGNGTSLDMFYFYKVEQLTVLSILFVVILIGNIGILYTLLFRHGRKSRMNYFITHLAIADLSVGVINVLTDLVWRMTVDWYAGNVACKIVRFMQALVTYASTYVLVALSIDRYDAIRHPMKFSGSWRRAKCLVVTAWCCSALFSITSLVFFEETKVEGSLQCWINFDRTWKWRLYITLLSCVVFVIPALIIMACYAVIIATIWSRNSKSFIRQVRTSTIESDSRRASSRGLIPKAKVKTVKITFVIVTVFILCWSPYFIFNLLEVFGHVTRSQTNIAISTFIQSLAPLNSAANPIIYYLFSTHFCRTLRSLPCVKWMLGKKNGGFGESTTATHSSTISEFMTSRKKTEKNVTVQDVLVH